MDAGHKSGTTGDKMTYENPDWSEDKTRMEEQRTRLKKIVLDAKKALPERRWSASMELTRQIRKLKDNLHDLELFQMDYFIDEENRITPVGKVGRAIDTDFAIMELKTCISLLDRVKESLDFQSSEVKQT